MKVKKADYMKQISVGKCNELAATVAAATAATFTITSVKGVIYVFSEIFYFILLMPNLFCSKHYSI